MRKASSVCHSQNARKETISGDCRLAWLILGLTHGARLLAHSFKSLNNFFNQKKAKIGVILFHLSLPVKNILQTP